jgi:hypothetical protein
MFSRLLGSQTVFCKCLLVQDHHFRDFEDSLELLLLAIISEKKAKNSQIYITEVRYSKMLGTNKIKDKILKTPKKIPFLVGLSL